MTRLALVGAAVSFAAWVFLVNKGRIARVPEFISRIPRSSLSVFLAFAIVATSVAQKGGTNAPPNGASPPQMMGLLPQGADVERGATFICIGALLHIVEDAFCGKVPLFLPWQKVGIKLFTVGSVTEYLFSMAVVILTYIIHAQVMVK